MTLAITSLYIVHKMTRQDLVTDTVTPRAITRDVTRPVHGISTLTAAAVPRRHSCLPYCLWLHLVCD